MEVGEELLFPFPSSVATRAFGGECTRGAGGGSEGEVPLKAAFPQCRSLHHWLLGAGRTTILNVHIS